MSEINDKLRSKLLRQKEKRLFCDLDLLADDGTKFRVHAAVIHASSEYFEEVLTADVKKIEVNGVSGQLLEQLVHYCYTLDIIIDPANVQAILNAAKRFRMDGLVAKCVEFFSKELCIANVIDYLILATVYRLNGLQQEAEGFVATHFQDILQDPSFCRIPIGYLIKFLNDDDFAVKSERDVFETAAKWIEHDLQGRRQYVAALMKTIRMSKIDYEYIIERMQECLNRWDQSKVFVEVCLEKFRQGQTLTDARRRTPSDHVYIIGQVPETQNIQIQRYTPATDTWNSVRIFADSLWPHIHRIGTKLYAISSATGSYNVKVNSIDLQTMKMQEKKSATHTRYEFASVAWLYDIYVIGGYSSQGDVDFVERYSTKTGKWTELAKMQLKRSCMDAVSVGGKLYVVGGYNDGPLSLVECYDPIKDVWRSVASLNTGRWHHRCGVINGQIYAVGGSSSLNYGALSSIEKYDPTINKWEVISVDLGVPLRSFGLSIVDDCLYIFGGSDKINHNGSVAVQKINISSGEIVNLAEMPVKILGIHSCGHT